MYIKSIIGLGSAVIIGLGYGALHTMQTSPNQSSSSEIGVSKIGIQSNVTYGSLHDKVPSEKLAESVLSAPVKKQLSSASIKYNNSGAFIIDNNKTSLDASVKSMPYVQLSNQDQKGRPQVANAFLAQSSREYRNRQSTGNAKTIDPVGWHQLSLAKGVVLYNRGHSIGYALAGSIKGFDASEANQQNITTQTAWANQSSNGNAANTGQNYYETLVRKALDKSKTIRIRYRVTPVYDGGNFVPSGSHMEAKSNDGSLEYNVFVPNVQPGVSIDYETGFAKVVS